MAREIDICTGMISAQAPDMTLTWAFTSQRVTRIELALSAWETVLNLPVRLLACGCH